MTTTGEAVSGESAGEVDLFDRLHIEIMTREWFAGQEPTALDGYLVVLRKRLKRAAALTPDAELEKPQAVLSALRWTDMPSYGEIDWQQLREAVAEATIGNRRHVRDIPEGRYVGHDMTDINFNSLNRIVSAFVRAALRASPASPDEGWMPIASAPEKDIMLVGRFNQHGKWLTWKGQRHGETWYLDGIAGGNPTHWRLLPSPPSAPETEVAS